MRRTSVVALIVIAVVVLAGLAYYATRGPRAPVGEAPSDPLGVVEIPEGQPITIGYWLVVAGPDASLGIDTRRGIELAIDEIGGSLLGHPIRLVGEDSGCSAEGGVSAATKLAADRNIVAVVGSSCSSEAVPGVPILWNAGIVTVSPSNTAPQLTAPDRGDGFAGYLRTAHNDEVQGRVAAEFAYTSLGARTAATIHDGSPYAEGLQNVFARVFQELGGRITSQEAIGPNDTDMRPVLTRIASSRPEVIYYPIFISAGGHVTRQAREVAGLEQTTLMGADGMFSPDFLRAAGAAARNMYLSSPDLSAEVLGPRYTEFLAQYQQKYGERPLAAFHAHAFDAAMMIFEAIERVARQEGGTTFIGRQALRDALLETADFAGITGTLTCTEHGDCADPKIAVYQVVSADVARWTPGEDPKKVWPQ